LALPTIFSSLEEAGRINRQVVIPFVDKELRTNFNSFLLFRVLQNTQAMHSRKKLTCVADLKGQKIRSPGTNQQTVINKLGGNAVYIAWGEAVTAYATGTVDGGTAGVNMGANAGWFDYLKWSWDCNLGFAFGGALVNLVAFNALPKDLQTLLLEAGKETGVYSQEMWDKATRDGWDRARAQGVTITPLSTTDARTIEAAGAEVAKEWLAKPGRSDKAKELYRLIEAARK
jgi:TRAP-type C4-dicarboxylate transport system substrate-binding protein